MTTVTDRAFTTPLLTEAEPAFAPIELATDLSGLVGRLRAELVAANWLDAYLLAVGIQQLLDDRCGRLRKLSRRAASHFAKSDGRMPIAMASMIRRLDRGATRTATPHARPPSRSAFRAELDAFVLALAHVVLAHDAVPSAIGPTLVHRGEQVLDRLVASGDLLADLVRLPSCFHSFDQRPEDVVRLVELFAGRFPKRDRPLAVVGVRTSGSYLGPLCAAALDRLGYVDVLPITVRPGWPVTRATRDRLARLGAAGGLVLVLDDPPTTGSSLATVVNDLRADAGLRAESFALLLASFSELIVLPDSLQSTALVHLPESAWTCRGQFAPEAVADVLTRLLADTHLVQNVEALEELRAPERGHFHRRFRVQLAEPETGVTRLETIVAEGVGLGYFGRHAIGVCAAAPQLFTPVFGFADGLIYRRYVSEAGRARFETLNPRSVALIADHVVERQTALRVPVDRSDALSGRQPAWEVAARTAARPLGPLAFFARPMLVDPLMRRLLATSTPSIISGPTATSGWFLRDERRPAVRVDPGEGAFGHLDLASYDAVFDLAGAAVAADDLGVARALRQHYEMRTGAAIDPERWLLLQLVQLWNERRLDRLDPLEVSRRQARVFQAFVFDRYLADLGERGTGPYCAFDLDGVLETSTLGFSATTNAGGLALRALCVHGYRIVLASGRSLSEIVDRCNAFGLAGGVAEYGSVLYDHGRRVAVELLSQDSIELLATFRSLVAGEDGLITDPAYARSVRVFERDANGHRRGIDRARALELLERYGLTNRLGAVVGEDQTDFVATGVSEFIASGVSKGTGLRALLAQLHGVGIDDVTNERPLAFAIGDSAADASMLAIARLGATPANGDASLDGVATYRSRRAYQAGVADSVGQLIGHRPGACARCRMPARRRDARQLMDLVSLQENGVRGIPARLFRLALSESARPGSS